MNKKPLVSIIIPVYNGEKYIEEAIESAINQTYKNVEVIVINDGSTDKTEMKIRKYLKKIKYFRKENGGVSSALNYGISKMKGQYFSWLSHDDKYNSNKIEEQIKYLIENKLDNKTIILYSDFDAIDSKSKVLWHEIKNHQELEKKEKYAILKGNLNGISLLIPKEAFAEFGLFDTSLACVQDYELWYRMSKKYHFIHMDKILVASRFHKNQVSVQNSKVVSEGNTFWLKVLKEVTEKEMIELEGSPNKFYNEMAKFYEKTSYNKVYDYCKSNITEELPIEQSKSKNNPFKSLILSIKTIGIKKTMEKIILKFKQLLKFGIVGITNTIVSLVVYYILIYFNTNYNLATVIGYIISSISGYYLNKKWVFEYKKRTKATIIKYYTVYASALLINIGCMTFQVEVLKISKVIAPIITIIITTIYNYIFSKKWVFKENRR